MGATQHGPLSTPTSALFPASTRLRLPSMQLCCRNGVKLGAAEQSPACWVVVAPLLLLLWPNADRRLRQHAAGVSASRPV